MTEVELGIPPLAPAPEETPAPAPEAAPQPQQDFVQMDRARITAAGYSDYKDALREGQQYRQFQNQGVYTNYQSLQAQAERLGYGTVDALIAELATVNPEAAAAVAEEVPGMPPASAMDPEALLDQLDQRLDKRFQDERDSVNQARNEADRASTVERARGAENDFAVKTLGELGLKMPEDANAFAPEYWKEFNAFFMCLQHVRQQGLSPIMTDGQQQQVLEGQASAAEMQQAQEMWSNTVKDADTRRVAALAQQQELTPGATLAGGPAGGAPSQKPWEQLSKREQLAEIKRDVLGG